MTKLYRLKGRAVREIEDGDALRLRCLKRAGFVVGELPPPRKAKRPVEAKPIAPTEGEDLDGSDERKPVLATHSPIEDFLVGVTNEPIEDFLVGVTAKAATPLSEMSMKELRAVAKENEITVPFEVRTKKDIAAYLTEKLEGSE